MKRNADTDSARVDKDVFLDVDFVRQNPMLVNDVDKLEFAEVFYETTI